MPFVLHFLARNEAHFAGGIDEINSRRIVGEIRATFGIGHDFAHTPEGLVSDLACQHLPCRMQDNQFRRFIAFGQDGRPDPNTSFPPQ